MKNVLLVVFALVYSIAAQAQTIVGTWSGMLEVMGTELGIVIHVEQADSGYISTMDSPDQSSFGIPVTKTTFEHPAFAFEVANLAAEFSGELSGDQITGIFKQMGQEFPLTFFRGEQEKKEMIRPQHHAEPFPYHSEEVFFENKAAGIKLAGTLTLPKQKGSFPAVVLISGSGPQNRDEEVAGHKPFLVLSDHLTRNGIAVLRYDDRGSHGSTGDFNAATTADFATDVEAALEYLVSRKEIQKDKIGLIGHSEGGIIAPMVAARSEKVAFIVLLAGTGIPGDELLLIQQRLIGEASGISEEDLEESKQMNEVIFNFVKTVENTEGLPGLLEVFLIQQFDENPVFSVPEGTDKEMVIQSIVGSFPAPWMPWFLKYDPAPMLEKVTCPVLAVNGEKDLQVPAGINLDAIRQALERGGNSDVTIIEFPGLNHLFQECETGSPSEYVKIEQTFAPVALDAVTTWITEQTK